MKENGKGGKLESWKRSKRRNVGICFKKENGVDVKWWKTVFINTAKNFQHSGKTVFIGI